MLCGVNNLCGYIFCLDACGSDDPVRAGPRHARLCRGRRARRSVRPPARGLREWGIRGGALFAAETELHRIAGAVLDPNTARRLTLYDGYDVVGELQLDLEGAVPAELLELLQDVFGLGIGRRVRMGQLDLVNAAVAVNSAESLDEALDALAEACRRIANAPNALVTVWEPALGQGRVRAAAGDALLVVGEEIGPGDYVAYRAAVSGRGALARTGDFKGLGPRLQDLLSRYHCVIAVPLVVEGAPPITFEVAWPAEPRPMDVERTIVTVQKLGALTSVAFRAAEERARLAHTERLRRVIETVPDGILIHQDGIDVLNAAAKELFGEDGAIDRASYRPRRLDGTPVTPDRYPSAVCLRTGREASERMLMTIQDEERVVEVKAAPMSGGFVALLRDVTEEHTEQALTKEFLEQLFASLPLAAVVLDAESGLVLQANAAFERLVERTPDEVIGTGAPHLWCDNSDRLRQATDRRLIDAVYRRKDGRAVPVELLRFRIAGGAGAPSRIVVLAQDMTERREFDRRLIQSGKLVAIGELAAGVAHEINNPLFAILGLVEFLLRDTEEGTKAHNRLQLIQQTGLEIKEIVKALLDFARERTDDYRPMLLRDVVLETVELVRRTSAVKDVEIVERFDDEETRTIGSPNQIKQVLLNLITNAQHAMQATGGTITVKVEHDDETVVATVTDTGPGIEADVLQRIFEPFFTTKRDFGGTGLGLAVSHGIAEMHGGSLTAESERGAGATFRLRLPRYEGEEV